MTDSDDTLFPHPDSPTRQWVSPLFREKSTPLTAWTTPFSVLNRTCKDLTSKITEAPPLQIERQQDAVLLSK